MLELHSHLVAEIEFWRELIDNQDESSCEATVERMRLALALAERKLSLLTAGVAGVAETETVFRTKH